MYPSHRPRSVASPANLPSHPDDEVALGCASDQGRPTRRRAPLEVTDIRQHQSRGHCLVAESDELGLAIAQQWPVRGRRLPQLPLCRVVLHEYPGALDIGPRLRRQLHFVARASSESTPAALLALAVVPKKLASVPPALPVQLLPPASEQKLMPLALSVQAPQQVPDWAAQEGELRKPAVLPW